MQRLDLTVVILARLASLRLMLDRYVEVLSCSRQQRSDEVQIGFAKYSEKRHFGRVSMQRTGLYLYCFNTIPWIIEVIHSSENLLLDDSREATANLDLHVQWIS